MPTSFFGHQIIHLESVDSTNNYAAKVFKSEDVKPGAVIMADIQTDGRGQREKTWQSGAFENLTFSLIADIKLWKINTLIDLNRLIALALWDFFKDLGLQPEIKWPNDIMIENQKISGILIENFFRNGNPKTIIGIGINVNQRDFDVPRATSLSKLLDTKFDPKELLFKFIGVINDTFNDLPIQDSSSIHQAYDSKLWKLGESHKFLNDQMVEKSGSIASTTSTGELVVQFDDQTSIFRNGEVRY